MFLVRLVADNAGDLVVCELLGALWRDFLAGTDRGVYKFAPTLLTSAEDKPIVAVDDDDDDDGGSTEKERA